MTAELVLKKGFASQGEETLNVTGLCFRNLNAKITVDVHEDNRSFLKYTDPDGDLKDVRTYMDNGVATFEGAWDGSGSSGNNIHIVSGGGSIHISGGNFTINGQRITSNGKELATAHIHVVVPFGTSVEIDQISGKAKIGDINAPLVGYTSTADIEAGLVTSANIEVKGIGNVEIHAVVGGNIDATIRGQGDVIVNNVKDVPKIDCTIKGQGNISIKNGNAGKLELSCKGMGNTFFGGTAQTADLSVQGMGNITVNRVTGTIDRSVKGMGRINVMNR